MSPTGWVRVATDYDRDGRFDTIESLFIYDLHRAREISRQRADHESRFAESAEQRGERRGRRSPGDEPTGDTRRVQAEILSTRKARFRGFDEPHLVARIETARGQREYVNLGPESKLEPLDLQAGDQVSLRVRSGRINGQAALIAEQVRAEDTTVELPRPEDRQRFRSPNQEQQKDRQQDDEGYADRRDQPPRQDRQPRPQDPRVTTPESERSALGVTLREGGPRGVRIERILRDSPAERSALQAGDQIIAIEDRDVGSYQDVVRALREFSADEQIKIRTRRNGRTHDITVRLAARSEVFGDRDQNQPSLE